MSRILCRKEITWTLIPVDGDPIILREYKDQKLRYMNAVDPKTETARLIKIAQQEECLKCQHFLTEMNLNKLPLWYRVIHWRELFDVWGKARLQVWNMMYDSDYTTFYVSPMDKISVSTRYEMVDFGEYTLTELSELLSADEFVKYLIDSGIYTEKELK